ncbi:MAG TPA: MiaB/RimO family radical SAM methylthiotransferase, partial [Armatimonadota bacterium]|nr:MiaB/RimO family radical SAM methylthiotransferase [Armatimonadota bacterium]
YCVVPHARGPARSRPVAEVVEEVRRVADAGFREVVLTGTCIGSYGKDFRPRVKLAECVAAVAAVPGLKRVRISSIEPWDVDGELIALVAGDPVVCAHFHLPLQSGDDGLRRRMRRAGTSAQFADLVARIRERLPDAGITTDVIVGFPGETDAEFEVTRDFCKQVQFSRMHVFRYSPRPFTHAATLPDRVPRAIANARSRVLIRMGEEMSQAFACRWVGRSVSVLVEGQNDPEGRFEGLTESYVRVLFTSERALARGELVNVEVSEAREGCLYGRVSGNE